MNVSPPRLGTVDPTNLDGDRPTDDNLILQNVSILCRTREHD